MKYIKNIKNNALEEFPLKRFSPGTLYIWPCILLSAALSACSSSTPENIIDHLEGVYTVVFDKNGGDTEANPQSKTVVPPATTLDALPEAPTREDHIFVGWRTAADGSGTLFTENTLVRESLRVYAQWELDSTRLSMAISPSAEILTPIIYGDYNEYSTTFRVVVSGFENAADARKATLGINHINGLSFEIESTTEGNTQIFEVSVTYNGQAAFAEGFATVQLSLANIADYKAESRNTRIYIRDGQAANPSRVIPVKQANIVAFNRYAGTLDGLKKHYSLTENIRLAEPAPTTASNWTAIGGTFTGSFNGNGHTIFGLRIRASNRPDQGLFGGIGEGTTLENLGLIDVSVHGDSSVGGLVGVNLGTVQNCYATGSVTSNNLVVGGLVGRNHGTVQNCYATVSVSGENELGGLVGYNRGTVQNSYATGSVTGDRYFGGQLGGLVGWNSGGTVQNNLALNQRVAGAVDGLSVRRVAGINEGGGSLINNRAFIGMRNTNNTTTWNNKALNDRDGADLTAAALQAAEGFPAAFGTTPWTYARGRLPGLFGETVEMPGHISP